MKKRLFVAMLAVGLGSVVASAEADAGQGCRGSSSSSSYGYSVVVSKPVVVSQAVVVVPKVVIPRPEVKVPQGSTLRLKVNFLGNEPGVVIFSSGNITLNCEIVEWNPNFVIVRMPDAGFLAETQGRLSVTTSDGIVKRKIEVLVQPTPDIEVVATGDFIQRAPREIGFQGNLNTGGLEVSK